MRHVSRHPLGKHPSRCSLLWLSAKKKRYVITGIAANDQVRAFCYDLGWIMRDLDEESGTGRYFQRNGSRRKYPDFKAISKAVKALGGILEVRWQEE